MSGTSVNLQIRDATGEVAYTGAITIQAGVDNGCLGGGGGATGSVSGASSVVAAVRV